MRLPPYHFLSGVQADTAELEESLAASEARLREEERKNVEAVRAVPQVLWIDNDSLLTFELPRLFLVSSQAAALASLESVADRQLLDQELRTRRVVELEELLDEARDQIQWLQRSLDPSEQRREQVRLGTALEELQEAQRQVRRRPGQQLVHFLFWCSHAPLSYRNCR